MKTIVEQVMGYARTTPDKMAITDGKHAVTYQELARAILGAKHMLQVDFSIHADDFVILAADKQLSFVSVYFALHLIGARVLPLAPDVNPKRYAYICTVCHPSLIIGLEPPAGMDISATGLDAFAGAADGVEDTADVTFPAEDAIADVLFTTGTTGNPKGVILTQRNIYAQARNINTFVQNTTDDVEMLALPISHSFGLGRMKCALSNGQSLILLGSFANMKRFYRFMEQYHVTGFGMVPAAWSLIQRLSGEKLGKYASQLHYIEIGSAPMPMADKEKLVRLLSETRICMHYGLTEASRSTFIEFHTDHARLDTIGKATPNVTIRVKDEQGRDVPVGEPGEICVSGDVVSPGYLHAPLSRDHYYWGEFFRTGDLGVQEPSGYVRLISRKKELINVGGKKVSPVEVEAALLQMDGIEDCACVAEPDPDGVLGEVVKAYVVMRDAGAYQPETWTGMLRTMLEDYMVPRMYERIDQIPKTSSGKVQRLKLKDRGKD